MSLTILLLLINIIYYIFVANAINKPVPIIVLCNVQAYIKML